MLKAHRLWWGGMGSQGFNGSLGFKVQGLGFKADCGKESSASYLWGSAVGMGAC